jgi:hypothetical protein
MSRLLEGPYIHPIVAYRPAARQRPRNKQLYNVSANKNVSAAIREYSNNGRDVFYAISAEML